MPRVKIDTPGVTVEVEADGALHDITDVALKVFRDAGGWPQTGHGSSSGFTFLERGPTPDLPMEAS